MDEIVLPNGIKFSGSNAERMRKRVAAGEFPPAPDDWEQSEWEEQIEMSLLLAPTPDLHETLLVESRPTLSATLDMGCKECGGTREIRMVIEGGAGFRKRLCRCTVMLDTLGRIKAAYAPADGAHRLKEGVKPFGGHLLFGGPSRVQNPPDAMLYGPQDWFSAHISIWVAQHQNTTAIVVSDADVHEAYKPVRFGQDEDDEKGTARGDKGEVMWTPTERELTRGYLLSIPVLIIEVGVLTRKVRESRVVEVVRDRQHRGHPTWLWSQGGIPKVLQELVKTWRTIRA